MNDLISRQAAIDRLKREEKVLYTPTGMNYLIRAIKDLPPVNPQPKTGHWINGDCKGGNCSICGEYYAFYPESGDFNYCPNCGAKMVEPQESEG